MHTQASRYPRGHSYPEVCVGSNIVIDWIGIPSKQKGSLYKQIPVAFYSCLKKGLGASKEG